MSFKAQSQDPKADARYVLRTGDKLQLKYRLTPDLDQIVAVQPDGFVSLNVVGEIQVAGMTIDQAHDAILAKASERLNQAELILILKEFTPPSVVVAGEVRHPGKIELREGTTALSAIMQSGGLSDSAKSGQLLLLRKVNDRFAEVHQLNFSKMKETPSLEHDMALEPGDTLYVPRDRIAIVKHYTSLLNIGATFNPTTAFRGTP